MLTSASRLVEGAGSWNWYLLAECGVAECGGVAYRGLDADAEQVADAADVAAGGVDLGEDAVGAQGLWGSSRPWPRGRSRLAR